MYDPYARFHNLNDPETRRFAAEAHAETLAQFAGSAEFSALRDDIFDQLQDERQIPFCQEHRARMYHFHQSEEFPKGVYRVCSAASYRAGMPDWEILFSVADFDEILGDDVYLDGVSHYVEQPLQALLTLSAAGGDAAYTTSPGATRTVCGSAPRGTNASSPRRVIRAKCGCCGAVRNFQTACRFSAWKKTA